MATDIGNPERYELQDILRSPCLPYQPASLPMLTSYLEEHAAKNTVKPELCTAILKLYTLYPQCTDPLILRKIIIQGIVGLAEHDPVIYISMISTSSRAHKKVGEVLVLTEHVQDCKFKQVWEMLKEPSMQDVVQTPGLVESIRTFACSIIALTFQSLTLSDFMQLVNLGPTNTSGFEDRLEKLIKSHGWTLEESNSQKYVVLPSLGSRDADSSASSGSMVHRTVEKYMSPDGLKSCLSVLLH